jgi:hypothetical protein
MRMLRLSAGWSAETLSRRYGDAGVGYLTRTTIAKIESGARQIKAGEVEGVARAFGLNAADLLDPGGPSVFLSYAEQDGSTGHQVAAWLGDHGFRVASAGSPVADDPAASGSAQWQGIGAAQAFVVLLSPSFLSSPRCQDELNLALRRKQQLASAGIATDFIYVLRLAETSSLDDSGLQSYSPVDLPAAGGWPKEVALSKLGGSILLSAPAPAAPAGPQDRGQAGHDFLDRAEELDRVLYNLRNSGGPHFWLVIGPPGLGKSRFLRQLETKVTESGPMAWVTSMVDLRHRETGRPHDAMTVLAELFDMEQPRSSAPDDDLLAIAQKIIRRGQPWLCLLDSAELLHANSVVQLRRYLGRIYGLIQDARSADARLAFVVASRLDDRWRGVTPYPGMSVLPLGGFGAAAIQDALNGLAAGLPGVRSPAELRRDAALVQHVTEGVPELVLRSLRWIQDEEWLELHRLNNQQLFDKIVVPYVQDSLLARDSLLPGGESQSSRSAEQLDALREAMRVLVPYRLFTRYHVQYQLDNDPSFREAVKDAKWQVDDLWQAIAGMALLNRPLGEPWQEIHPAVRRLLYRYFYPENKRADAHRRAQDFTKKWAAELAGKEQIVGMVEAIWHEAARLKLSDNVMMEGDLTSFARNLSLSVRPSPYNETELRDYAAERLRNDDELQREVAEAEGLFDELVEVVLAPEGS